MPTADYVIFGAGVVGLTIARELKRRNPSGKVLVIEKESMPGLHSSGRNSGVLHSGIYYPRDSLKAKLCRQGAIEMAQYHKDSQLRLDRRGKILIATCEEDSPQLDLLAQRAKLNGVEAEFLDAQALKELEPEARSATGKALWVPSTAVGSPAEVMKTLVGEVKSMGVELRCNALLAQAKPERKMVTFKNGETVGYGHAINASGLHADRLAHLFGVGRRYTLLPFKGIYWKLDPDSGIRIHHLIYPVPDLRVPFLGVHTTTTTDGSTYFGPTAVPAFGRENYNGLRGVSIGEAGRISLLLLRQYVSGRDGFRRLAVQEGRRYFKSWFADAAQAVVPRLRPEHLQPTEKVGIRAQMLDKQTGRLVTDFLVERGESSTHILNAISPAWTSAFPFARYICDHFIERTN
ncbi:L-2-hydroxyglutarate oxidase [Sedimenticola hydrogenitrophicus]|uniref:L-2-hydroxyglutarate oxidase n=1 Tax=Sedimenticola hydrogenitrophicus TaxID=2967975 RepID=UPI0021A81E2F